MPSLTSMTFGMAELGRNAAAGSAEEERAVSIVADLFVNTEAWVDTSNNYTRGRSETIIGKAIARAGGDSAMRIITKVDRHDRTWRFDRDRVLASFEESLARLGVDRVPLLHLHDPYTMTFEAAMGSQGAVGAMLELQDAGLVDAIGIAAGPVPTIRRYLETGVFAAVLCHSRFNLIDRSARELFADAKSRGMQVFNAAPFGAGILATGSRDGSMFAYLPTTPELRRWVAALEGRCEAYGVSLRALALQFSLRSDLVDSTVVGAVSPGRRQQLDELAAVAIPDDLWQEIEGLRPAPTTIDDNDPRRIRLYLEQIKPENYWDEA